MRPRHRASENDRFAHHSPPLLARFNEAEASSLGKQQDPDFREVVRGASMRPRHRASENRAGVEHPRGERRFNEAEASSLGKLNRSLSRWAGPVCFNEAEASSLGKRMRM